MMSVLTFLHDFRSLHVSWLQLHAQDHHKYLCMFNHTLRVRCKLTP